MNPRKPNGVLTGTHMGLLNGTSFVETMVLSKKRARTQNRERERESEREAVRARLNEGKGGQANDRGRDTELCRRGLLTPSRKGDSGCGKTLCNFR